uniref:Uncharacterized protein n=1 Tax=Polytomella parva TaxID=51329 RepID=A0A7S0UM05_9CHLO|mmetsp:Transcript_10505/g.19273  ORF Transcript_10505/g.19273 Transcript_10505/m.19273 type:complete len:123 (+) Transcript_10505:49-417(+)
MSYLSLLVPAEKRTLSKVLLNLPQHGIGGIYSRDSWHPTCQKYWEILEYITLKDDNSKGDAYGFLYFQGEKIHPFPKRNQSVWRYGWFWRPKPEQEKVLKPLKDRYDILVEMGIIDPAKYNV